MCVVLALAVAAPPQSVAQQSPFGPAAERTFKFVELKYLTGDRLSRAIVLVQKLLPPPQVEIMSDHVLNAVAIRGTPTDIASAEQLLRRFDTPTTARADRGALQIRLTVYMLEGLDQPASDQSFPADLSAAVQQIRSAFGYKGYRLLETVPLQSRERSEFHLNGLLPSTGTGNSEKIFYTVGYKLVGYDDEHKSVWVNGFRFNIRIPISRSTNNEISYGDSGVQTDLTIKDGQKLVLGKLTKDQNERVMFLVLTARVE
jgi:hypothetical protein